MYSTSLAWFFVTYNKYMKLNIQNLQLLRKHENIGALFNQWIPDVAGKFQKKIQIKFCDM